VRSFITVQRPQHFTALLSFAFLALVLVFMFLAAWAGERADRKKKEREDHRGE
jgi:uncharacterized membrane protein